MCFPSIDKTPRHCLRGLPMWHIVFFRNARGLTYYWPHLVRKGVLTVEHIHQQGAAERFCASATNVATHLCGRAEDNSGLPLQDMPVP